MNMARVLFASLVLLFPSTAAAGEPAPLPCEAGTIELEAGSTLDVGFTGQHHDDELAAGTSLGFAIASRCSDDQSLCTTDGDCENDDCVATCDCGADTTCDITGPVGQKRCLTTLAECTESDDCPALVPCVTMFGPPQPFSSAGVPTCVVANIDAPVTGTLDASSGALTFSTTLLWRTFLGIDIDIPCPRCGAPDENPKIGDQLVCEGGQRDGEACTVDGVTEDFGGTSFDCAPALASNISGPGHPVPLFEVTTGTATRTAQLPCKFFGFTDNPLVPGTHPKCTDDRDAEADCTSNSDCRRCTGDPTIHCTSNDDCTEAGTCAEAPDQPVTCGMWCHCGFCNNNPASPCIEDGDCPEGSECVMGTGTGTQANAPQQRPNDCSAQDDGFICGTISDETCATAVNGICALAPWRACENDEDCEEGEGACTTEPRSCFEPRITREGDATPFGTYCAFEDKACESNADCTGTDDFCADASAHAGLAGVSCMSATSNSATNSIYGITGPIAFHWNTRLKLCACDGFEEGCEQACGPQPGCGDLLVQDNEECDGGACCDEDCTFTDPSVTCREAVDDCDVAETCTGSGDDCPDDSPADDGTECDDGSECTDDDACTAGVCEGDFTSCGNGTIDEECSEECDDGNTANGDGCSSTCGDQILCGDATEDGEILASDAQRILQKAVGINVQCNFAVCDVDDSGAILTSDALRVLKAAVEQPVELLCDYDG